MTTLYAIASSGGSGGGVTSLNTLTGAVTLAAGTNITLSPSGNTITIAASSGGSPSIGGVLTGATAGSVLFAGSGTFAQDNAQLFWDDTDHWLGIGTAVPTNSITFASTANGISANNQTDQVTNYERMVAQWQSNVFTIGTYYGGTGTARSLQLGINNTAGSGSGFTRVFTINTAPSTATGIFDSNINSTSVAGAMLTMQGTLSGASNTQSYHVIQPTINQSGTSSYNALLIQPYEQATGSGTKYLINAGTNSAASGGGTFTSKFSVTDAGAINGASSAIFTGRLASGTATTNSQVSFQTSISTTNWGTAGLGLNYLASSITDTNSSGTQGTHTSFYTIQAPTLSTSNTGVTFTNVSTLYVSGAPISGTNTPTFTNNYALFVDNGGSSGNALISGNLQIGTNIPANYAGAGVLSLYGALSTGVQSSSTGRWFNIGSGTITRTNDNTTYADSTAVSIGIPTLVAGAASTYTNASTFEILGAPVASTNVTIGTAYALKVAGGASLFAGAINSSASINFFASIQTTLNGTTAGSIIWSQPLQGGASKEFVAHAAAYENNTASNQTITFTAAFTNTPTIICNDTGLALTVSTTTLTIVAPNNTTTYTGNIIIKGY